MKKSIRMPYKLLSFLMAFAIVSVSIPFAYAAETLKASNISQYPTISYKNEDGKLYYGQTVGDGLVINDDEIVLDASGNQVAGHFEFMKPSLISSPGTNIKANIKFVPDNTDEYTEFKKLLSPVTYNVEKVVLVKVDEENDPLVASDVEAGSTLNTSILSGAKYTNPYNANEPNLLAESWRWAYPSTVVNESGYYEARFSPAGYDEIVEQVYVRIAGEIPETTITEVPTVPTLTYDGVTTWGDITLEGGKAELKIEGTEVEGTFSVTDNWKTAIVRVGSYEIDVVFTPADPEAALPYSLKIPVTVNKAPIRFVDENGNDIVPEITVPYGTKFSYVEQLLKPYIKGAEYTALIMGDLEYKSCEEDGTYTISAYAPSDGDHYEKTELTFKIIIEKEKINPKLYSEPGKLYIEDTSGIYNPTGTFTLIYYIGGEKQGAIEGIKYLERFDWNPTKSGNYEYEIVYVEATENEHYVIDAFKANNALTLSWAFKATGAAEGTTYQYGSEVALEAPATDPAKEDKPFYGFVKWEDANGNTGLTEEELSNREITFTMPDGEVDLNATYKFDFLLCIRYYIQIVVDFFTSFFQSIGTLF